MDKLNVIYDTNVIVSSFLSGNEDSATVKVLDIKDKSFYELVMENK